MKIGDIVKAKPKWVDWHSKNIVFCFSVANGTVERKIEKRYFSQIYFILNAKLGNKRPTGIIGHYGTSDNDRHIDRNNVYVTFTLKTEVGEVKYSCYVSEKDLNFVRKSK